MARELEDEVVGTSGGDNVKEDVEQEVEQEVVEQEDITKLSNMDIDAPATKPSADVATPTASVYPSPCPIGSTTFLMNVIPPTPQNSQPTDEQGKMDIDTKATNGGVETGANQPATSTADADTAGQHDTPMSDADADITGAADEQPTTCTTTSPAASRPPPSGPRLGLPPLRRSSRCSPSPMPPLRK